MPRIRTVKPELFQHSDLYDAEEATGLPIRLAFIALFTCCDREGRFKWRPRELKLSCLPYDTCDFSRVLDALTTRGFLVRYADTAGVEYGCIPSFTVHQVINNREQGSKLPSPTESGVVTRDARVDDAFTTPAKWKGKEGKGREGEQEGKGKEHRVISLEVEIWPTFQNFWDAYERKGNRKTAQVEWERTTQPEREAIMQNVPAYNASKPDKQYRKDGERYLKQRVWEDAIIAPTTSNNGKHKPESELLAETLALAAERSREHHPGPDQTKHLDGWRE
jgi:hypothetical protein